MNANNPNLSVQELKASIVTFSDDAIISKSPDGIITSWNQSAENLLGYSASEAIGKHTSFIIPAEHIAREQRKAERVKNGERLRHFETVRITKDGGLVDVSISISPIKDAQGNFAGTSHILRNITECRKTRLGIAELNELLERKVKERTAELQEANSALEAFSYSVSHDLRAPVRAIGSFSKIIHKDYATSLSPDIIGLLEHIESNSKRMNMIIDDLLALAKYTRQEPTLAATDMHRLFKAVWSNLKFSFPHHAQLELQALPTVYADVSMLEQVVVNLLTNAVKYSSKKENPVVTVGTEIVDGKTVFFVRDNGVGFDMQNYDRLFGVFERLHHTTEFEGTGVGLFLVKKIIEKHRGTVWAKGEIDKGAVFYFSLPDKN